MKSEYAKMRKTKVGVAAVAVMVAVVASSRQRSKGIKKEAIETWLFYITNFKEESG